MFLKILKKFSLLQSLVVMIVFSMLIPLPVLFGVYVHGAYTDKQEQTKILNYEKFKHSSEVFAESIWSYYPSIGKIIINQLILDEDVVSIYVYDANGKDFLSWENQTKPKEVFVIEEDIIKNGVKIGSLKMSFDQVTLFESLKSDLLLFGSVLLLQLVFIVLVVSYIYYYKVINPIQRLLVDAEKLSNKELDEPFVWTYDDEISSLGVALNRTRKSLKNLFDTLTRQNRTLDEKVKQRTMELEDANRYKSEFLANMSHEIRTPMNAIQGMSHLLEQTDLNTTQLNYVSKVKDASSVLMYLINDILDFSKIEAGKIDIENVAFDMHKEIKRSISIFAILTEDKGLSFESNFINTHRFFRGDSHRIIQIINNFLSNSIKFTSKGSISLNVEEKKVGDNYRLVFSVHDSGIGISEEKIYKLFQPFTQADASTTRKHGGTGLGLFISHQLASLMGGKIDIKSQENIGSVFSLELELEPVNGEEFQKETLNELFSPLDILVIEDDKNSAQIIEEYIRSFGFFVTTVSCYEEALEVLEKKTSFDLFIIDYQLPTINGDAIYRNIKEKFTKESLPPAIMISVDDDFKVRESAIISGFSKFLIKPINQSYLYDDITSICSIDTIKTNFDPSRIDFTNKTVLLVEDNDINMEVAIHLLKETGIKIETASNGKEAVEKMKNGAFDAVLMDIQMPVMDGYEATKIIREELKLKVPIIAMTANVMASDIDKCIEVGMVDHIGKPINIEEFYEVLLKQLNGEIKLERVVTKESSKIILDKEKAVKNLGKSNELWKKTATKFYAKYDTMCEQIEQMVKENNFDGLLNYIHTLKGLSGTIGATVLAKEAFDVEQKMKQNRVINEIDFESIFTKQKELFEILKVDI
jgi:signal transduction histidine kinase/DNA-binding response OmpR family regulator